MKAALNGHVEQQRHVMFQSSANEVRNLLKQMVKTLQETLDEKADEIFLAVRRDYRSVLGGSDLPQGEILPKAQRLMRKEVMGKIEKVEKTFRRVAGLEVEGDKQNGEGVDPTSDGDNTDDSGAAGQDTRNSEEAQPPATDDIAVEDVPLVTPEIKAEAAERPRTEPTSDDGPTAPAIMDPAIIEHSNAKQSATQSAIISTIEPSSIAAEENGDHANRESSYELMSGPSGEDSEESEGSLAADENSD